MLEKLFKTYARQQRHLHLQVAELLLARLERERTLLLNENLIDQFQIGRRKLLRIAYDLAIKERMHIMADDEGKVLLLANAEFRRSMLRRSGANEDVLHLDETAPAAVIPAIPPARRASGKPPRRVEAPARTAVRTVTRQPDDFSWFTLDVSPSRVKARKGTKEAKNGKGGKMPPKRQTLPERIRSPWTAPEGAGLD
jgi:hypothetical protein